MSRMVGREATTIVASPSAQPLNVLHFDKLFRLHTSALQTNHKLPLDLAVQTHFVTFNVKNLLRYHVINGYSFYTWMWRIGTN